MARIGELNFGSFISDRKQTRPGYEPELDSEHAYAFRWDRQMRRTFETLKPLELMVEPLVRYSQAFEKSRLLGSAVKVGPKQFPRVYELARQCAETLGMVIPSVYIVNSAVMNAMTYGTNDDYFILVHSALIDQLNDEELLDVLGHECGHIHNNHVVYLTALHLIERVAGMAYPPYSGLAVIPASMGLYAFRRRAEVTCDRAGLLCSKNLQAATKILAKLAVGSSKLFEQMDMDAFLSQYEEGRVEEGRFQELFAPHPWLPKRILSLKVFAESKLFRKHAGLGDDGLSMDEVDEKVNQILSVVETT